MPTSFPGVDAGTLGLLGASLLGGNDDFWSSSSIAVKDPLTGDTLLQTPLLQDDPEPLNVNIVDASSLFDAASGSIASASEAEAEISNPRSNPAESSSIDVSQPQHQQLQRQQLQLPSSPSSLDFVDVPTIETSERIERFEDDYGGFLSGGCNSFQVDVTFIFEFKVLFTL